jgi:hypothetical protein
VSGQRHAPASLPPGKDAVPIVQEAGWAPEPVWTSVENFAASGFRFPDRPPLSESLCRLRYSRLQGRRIYFLYNLTGRYSGIAWIFIWKSPVEFSFGLPTATTEAFSETCHSVKETTEDQD